MTYIKNPSKEQKKQWMEATKEKERQAMKQINQMAEQFQESPETIAEYLEFGAQFYNYSSRNTMLIYTQNKGATFVQSFKAWKDLGSSVKKGEKGISILVPVESTVLEVEKDKYVSLRNATREQREAYEQGKITGCTRLHFRIGTVFDISQTDYPREKYPELFQRGYDSEHHETLYEAIKEYAFQELDVETSIEDLKSIALNGYYMPAHNTITLNENLESTHKLSTMTHEIGHAILHKRMRDKSVSQKEYEADCMSILLYSHLGLEIPNSRKRHLADHFRTYQKQLLQEVQELSVEEQKTYANQKIENSFASVFSAYKEEVEKMQPHINRHLQETILMENTKSYTEKYLNLYAKKSTGISMQPNFEMEI